MKVPLIQKLKDKEKTPQIGNDPSHMRASLGHGQKQGFSKQLGSSGARQPYKGTDDALFLGKKLDKAHHLSKPSQGMDEDIPETERTNPATSARMRFGDGSTPSKNLIVH